MTNCRYLANKSICTHYENFENICVLGIPNYNPRVLIACKLQHGIAVQAKFYHGTATEKYTCQAVPNEL